jgi:hypothetical protein
MKRTRLFVFLLVLLPMAVWAQDVDRNETEQVATEKPETEKSEKNQFFLWKGILWVKTLIDSMAVATVDRSYIEQPKRPWAVELRSSASQATLKMESDLYYSDDLSGKFVTRSDNGFSTSLGAWLGYRGYGYGLSKELSKGEGTTHSFGAMGGSFGINLRLSTYRSSRPDVSTSFTEESGSMVESERADLDEPIRVRSLFIDGYYMFNGKHFSYAAAYDQSLIQRRSAGSLVAGAMYYHTSVAYNDDSNWPIILLMNNVGKIKFTQANVGLGYAYNWVPAKGWLISVQAMPMVTLYNKMHTYFYDVVDENGTNIYEAIIEGGDEFIENIENVNWKVVDWESTTKTNRLSWNVDARLSLVYNWSRFYLRLYGHYNRFVYKNDDGNGRLTDWTGYASLGFRF